MNAKQKKEIARIITELRALQPVLDELRDAIANAASEQRDAYDNLSEKAQEGDKGEAMQTIVDALETAESIIGDFDIEDIVTQLEEAAGE